MSEDKKIKAAITAVLYYLQEEVKAKKKPRNLWARSGREMIMQNREMVQRKGIKR